MDSWVERVLCINDRVNIYLKCLSKDKDVSLVRVEYMKFEYQERKL